MAAAPPPLPAAAAPPPPASAAVTQDEDDSLLAEMMRECAAARGEAASPMAAAAGAPMAKQQDRTASKHKSDVAGFGSGLRKGFLSSSSPSSKAGGGGSSHKALPTFTKQKQPGGGGKPSLVLPEVQAALAEGQREWQQQLPPALRALESGEWMTPDFTRRLTETPALRKALEDPRFGQVLAEFAADPTKAMRKYKDDAGVMAFLSSLSGLVGEHFEALGRQQQEEQHVQSSTAGGHPSALRGPLVEEALRRRHQEGQQQTATSTRAMRPKIVEIGPAAAERAREEQAAVDRILCDPGLRAILMDPHMQSVLQACGRGGGKGSLALAKSMADPGVAAKLRRLAAAGLVRLEQ